MEGGIVEKGVCVAVDGELDAPVENVERFGGDIPFPETLV